MSAFLRSRARRSNVAWILDTLADRRELRARRLLAEALHALPGGGEVFGVDLEAGKAAAVLQRRDRGGPAPHERIEHPSLWRRARQHHALDDLERLLRRMVGALRVLAVQARDAPQVLRVVADLEPLLADEDRARPRLLGLGVVGNAHAVDVEVVV